MLILCRHAPLQKKKKKKHTRNKTKQESYFDNHGEVVALVTDGIIMRESLACLYWTDSDHALNICKGVTCLYWKNKIVTMQVLNICEGVTCLYWTDSDQALNICEGVTSLYWTNKIVTRCRTSTLILVDFCV